MQRTFLVLVLLAALAGAGVFFLGRPVPEVVVYTALDRMFSEPILADFEKKTGIRVRAKYDTESTKTMALVAAIRAEKGRPRCDVFWNNEIVNTIRLKKEGLLARYEPEAAREFPPGLKDPEGCWTGFAARARVLLVNTNLVKPGEEPRSIHDLADPRWRGKAGMGKPLFGTVATHGACLFSTLGEEKAGAYYRSLKDNQVKIPGGNSDVARAVAAGSLAFGITDTDDAIVEVEQKNPVKIVYPDAGPDDLGVLFIPNTLSLIRDGPNPDGGRKLIEHLLSPEVEIALAKGPSAQIPVNPAVVGTPRVKTPKEVKPMAVDFNAAADGFQKAANFFEELFLE